MTGLVAEDVAVEERGERLGAVLDVLGLGVDVVVAAASRVRGQVREGGPHPGLQLAEHLGRRPTAASRTGCSWCGRSRPSGRRASGCNSPAKKRGNSPRWASTWAADHSPSGARVSRAGSKSSASCQQLLVEAGVLGPDLRRPSPLVLHHEVAAGADPFDGRLQHLPGARNTLGCGRHRRRPVSRWR